MSMRAFDSAGDAGVCAGAGVVGLCARTLETSLESSKVVTIATLRRRAFPGVLIAGVSVALAMKT
jgi:hypothetical protein